MDNKKYTYADSGVDVGRNDEFTDFIKSEVFLPEWVIKEPTGYATILNITNPPIVLTADGIGSKLLLEIELGRLCEAAIDLIAMNYNDIVCVGGQPLAFVDYLGVHHIDQVHYKFIEFLQQELAKLGMALVAGETAEIPSIYSEREWDVAGFCVGILKRKLPVDTIEPGDIIIGLPASGFHSNGWSLIRKILKDENISPDELPFDLLAGTRIYSEVIQMFDRIKGLAHVTGGGLLRALKRVLRGKGAKVEIRKLPDYMQWVLRYVTVEEAMKTFNMGYGMLLITKKEHSLDLLSNLDGEVLGEVWEGGMEIKCNY
ncbi:phosphoribosylformylglycinamidine cyclo-ligase [Fervidobacterium thailandense]|uniref:Phosphoribosylformylglycinamidine cyclo-ligase n=1 Tax=Fervidobacterium thailandense TaxID=1008305 RepID=A0A1E3G252_9BACT|nr:phosphoribosylformylglycinamidine cyclo-ligase [Fervidobacterium thailandense]ODN30272.1 phosphoribosylformylglycinamidine cyclo-ligase [Fervidobacterium thailandense]